MSLKAFHIFFIVVSLIFCVGLGFWGIQSYFGIQDASDLAVGVIGFVSAGLLAVYLRYVLKKYKDISLL